ncbi:MAG: enoyl-CoA hydratase/isomerase family protein, partial [Porticoccaceae bacterium]|nr:enoyl-CoA hydratase/isomerase family protein [Porticoccaceae bacterium]
MAFASDVVSIEKNGAVGTLWLDRPEKYNALTPAVWAAIPEAINELAADTDIRAIIFAGRGNHFCAGIDLMAGGLDAELVKQSPSEAVANLNQLGFTTAFQEAISSLA